MDGESGATDAYGIRVQYNAVGRLFSTSAAVYAFIRNVDYGIYAEYGGQAVDCANAQISGVGTSAAAHDATSYGYEDYP